MLWQLTLVLDDHASDSDGRVGGHLLGAEPAALVALLSEFRGAVFSIQLVRLTIQIGREDEILLVG